MSTLSSNQRHLKRLCIIRFLDHVTISVINDNSKNDPALFSDNKIITSKYTWWNFIFIFLFENFNPLVKFANFYFLCVAILEVLMVCHFDYIVYPSHFSNKWKTSVIRSFVICFTN